MPIITMEHGDPAPPSSVVATAPTALAAAAAPPPRAPLAPTPVPTPVPPAAATSDDISEHDLDAIGLPDSEEIELGQIAPKPTGRRVVVIPPLHEDSGKVSMTTQATVAAAGFLDTDFGELANDIEKAVHQLQSPVPAVVELDASIRYASIEDAISSISPADPATADSTTPPPPPPGARAPSRSCRRRRSPVPRSRPSAGD
jgi:hypothetical protein